MDGKGEDQKAGCGGLGQKAEAPDQGHQGHGAAEKDVVAQGFEVREFGRRTAPDGGAGELVDQRLSDRRRPQENERDQAADEVFPQL